MRAIWLALGLGLAMLAPAVGRAEDAPVVVELFTSQGCSSCPPAEAFLTDLARKRHDVLGHDVGGHDVLALAFHVTYWNNLGWKDPFALDAATERQRDYARLFGDDGVYTPQMVVDGVHGFVGSRRAEGLNEIARAAPKRVAVRLTRAGADLLISVGAGSGDARILLVGYDSEHQTQVGRGENGGRTLLESNIVRSFAQLRAWNGVPVEFRQSVPAGEAYAVLLQAADGRIIGATRLEKSIS